MKSGSVHAGLAALLVSACHPQPPTLVMPLLASCGVPARLQAVLAADVAQGRAPEASPKGRCVANAASGGSIPASLLLAQVYRQAMTAGSASSPAALGLDLFGRQVGWLRMAALQGDQAAQFQLAQAMDVAAYRPMSDMALAWYQTAAENGNRPALAAIAAGYSAGRIPGERLYDFRKWLEGQGNQASAYRETARLLARPAPFRVPG